MTLEELEIVVKANVEEATKKLDDLKGKLEDSTSEGFKQITQQSDKMGEAVTESGEAIGKMLPQLTSLATKSATGSTAVAGLSKAIATASLSIKTALPILLIISAVIIVIVKAVTSLTNKIGKVVSTFRTGLKVVLDTILGLLQKIGSMAVQLTGILANLTRNGINNLVQVSDSLNNALSSIYGKSVQLGNALASAVAPIIEALTPIIINLLNALISVANILGELTASLFGNATTYKRATSVTTDYAKAVGKANKEQQKMLAGFDELNVLADKSSGANGISTPVSEMFETKEIRKEIKDLANEIKKVFDKIKNEIEKGNFFGAGDILGKSLNEAIDKIPAEDLGKNLATVMNNGLDFVNGFLENKPLGKIGAKLGQFVAGWINEIKPEKVGKAIANVINNAFAFVGNFFSEVEAKAGFKNIGDKIATTLIEFIKNLDTEEVANTINTVVIGLLDLAIGFFDAWINKDGSGELNEKVQDLMDRIKWEEILDKLIEAIAKGWVAVEGTRWKLRATILGKILEWIGGQAQQQVLQQIQGVWEAIFGNCEQNGLTFEETLQKTWLSIKIWWRDRQKDIEDAGNNIKNFFKNLMIGITRKVIDGINLIIIKINSIDFQMPDWLGGASWSPSFPTLHYPDWAVLGKGGVVTQPTPALIGEYAGARSNPEIVTPQKILYETSTQANIPVMNAIEEMSDRLVEALNNIGVYAEFDYSKLKVGLDNENYRVGGKLYGI